MDSPLLAPVLASLLSVALSGIWLVVRMAPLAPHAEPPPGVAEELERIRELVSHWSENQSAALSLFPPRLGSATVGDSVDALRPLGRPTRLLLHADRVGDQVHWSIQLQYGSVVAHVHKGSIFAITVRPQATVIVALAEGRQVDAQLLTAEAAREALGPPDSDFTDHTERVITYEAALYEAELRWSPDGARLQGYGAYTLASTVLPTTPTPSDSRWVQNLPVVGHFALAGALLVVLSGLPVATVTLWLYPLAPPIIALCSYIVASRNLRGGRVDAE